VHGISVLMGEGKEGCGSERSVLCCTTAMNIARRQERDNVNFDHSSAYSVM